MNDDRKHARLPKATWLIGGFLVVFVVVWALLRSLWTSPSTLGSSMAPAATAPEAPRTVNYLALQPPSFYRVTWGTPQLPARLQTGEVVKVLVPLTNAGTETWPDTPMADPIERQGRGAVRLTHRWWHGQREVIAEDYTGRAHLPHPVKPGESLTLPLEVRLPATAGRYRLQLDLVHELVVRFEDMGAPRLIVPVEVDESSH